VLPLPARLAREGLITLEAASVALNVHLNIARRWVLRGRAGHRLEAFHSRPLGGWYTSREAVDRFLAATADLPTPTRFARG
jgi:hypothetical protein